MIYHCLTSEYYGLGGGVNTYINSLLRYKPSSVDPTILHTLDGLEQSKVDLLHIHEGHFLSELTGECPAVYTVHNHGSYCPSGTKYWSANQAVCDRKLSTLGCTVGHFINACGSRRPNNVIQNISRATHDLKILLRTKIPVLANSNFVRNQFIFNGLPPDQVITVHCGVNPPSRDPQPLTANIHKAQRLLFVGRIVPDKGLEWLLNALAHTSSSIRLDIAGEGWGRPKAEQLAQQLKLNERITWHGWCDTQQIEALYQECFAVVLPSLWPEPAGLVTLEGNARFRPVIASNAGGIPEYLNHDQTGLLVTNGSVKELSAAIQALADDYTKARNLGIKGQELYLKKFTVESHIQLLDDIYSKLIDKFKSKKINTFTN